MVLRDMVKRDMVKRGGCLAFVTNTHYHVTPHRVTQYQVTPYHVTLYQTLTRPPAARIFSARAWMKRWKFGCVR